MARNQTISFSDCSTIKLEGGYKVNILAYFIVFGLGLTIGFLTSVLSGARDALAPEAFKNEDEVSSRFEAQYRNFLNYNGTARGQEPIDE